MKRRLQPEDTQETEWFSTITPDDAAADEQAPYDAPSPPALHRGAHRC